MSGISLERVRRDLHLGGIWRPSGSGDILQVVDPSTGEHLTTVASATVDDGVEAVEAALAAANAWAATAPRARAEILRRAFELMRTELDFLAHLVVLENGKSLKDARAEVAYAADFCAGTRKKLSESPGP